MIFFFKLLIAFSLIVKTFKKELHPQVLGLTSFSMANSIPYPDQAQIAPVALQTSSFFIPFRPKASSGALDLSSLYLSVTTFEEVQGDEGPISGKVVLEHR